MTGGGSGGHITPILAVADELKRLRPEAKLVYIGQTGDHLSDIPRNHEQIDEVYTISAGKFRRYHNEGWRHFFDLRTMWSNLRDFFKFLAGTWQSYRLLGKLSPTAIYTPGGFVGVPVGLAGRLKRIPFITHDLDAVPGLANRINSRWAAMHAVALPKQYYKYPKNKTYYVGVPVSSAYAKVTASLQSDYRRGLNIPADAKVITVTGGGLGADKLNRAVIQIAQKLFTHYPNLYIIHIAGRNHDQSVKDLYTKELKPGLNNRLIVKGFVNDLYHYSASADVIVTRAGATAIAEFASQQKACIVVPNPLLTGAHQVKNAQILHKAHAVKLINEAELKANPDILTQSIQELLDFSEKRQELARNLTSLIKPNAAGELAKLIVKCAEGQGSAVKN